MHLFTCLGSFSEYSIHSYISRLGLLEPGRHGLPVDDIPDGVEVLGLAVLVLQVVGVLPGINAQQGDERAGNGVLVGTSHQSEGAALLVLHQPRPAASLDSGQRGVCLLAEGVDGSEIGVDSFLVIGNPR